MNSPSHVKPHFLGKLFSLPSRYSITIFSCQLLIFHYQLSIVNYQLSLRPQKSWLEPNRALARAKRGNGSSHFGHTLKGTKNILLLPSYFFPLTSSLLHLTSSIIQASCSLQNKKKCEDYWWYKKIIPTFAKKINVCPHY